jgi:hypothetical protein
MAINFVLTVLLGYESLRWSRNSEGKRSVEEEMSKIDVGKIDGEPLLEQATMLGRGVGNELVREGVVEKGAVKLNVPGKSSGMWKKRKE